MASVSKGDEDDVDFMSDEFLVECTKNDIRPGLLMKHSDKRRHDLLKKQEEFNQLNKTKNKSVKQLEEESREKSLNTEIGSDNKGYLLLQKMGYKPGTSIGKKEDNQEALKEPIPIVLKRNRLGLGEKTQAEKKKQKITEWREHLEQLSDPTEFRSRVQMNQINHQISRDLKKAQSCCETLDTRADKSEPDQPWYWPDRPKPQPQKDEDDVQNEIVASESDEDEDAEQVPIHEKLTQLVSYLRQHYCYCTWCGAEYEDAEDLEQNCPGETKDDH